MNPATQHLVPLVQAAIVSAMGWLVAYMPEPAPRSGMFLLPHQRKLLFEGLRFAGRLFGIVFAAWMVVYTVLTVVDLLY